MKLLSGPELAEQWGDIKPLVDEALKHGSGTVTSYGLFIQCLGATAQCWIRDGGICITRYENFENTKMLAIVACTYPGWFTDGPDLLGTLEDFARASDCKKTVVYGRKGWARALKQFGYKEPYTVLMKEI